MKTNLIKEAIRISREKLIDHPWHRYRKCHFSFIVQSNKILEWGMNKPGNPPVQYKYFSAVHSEIDALNKARGIINFNTGFEIINIRLNRTGMLRLSAPCETCNSTILRHGCTHVYFSKNSGSFLKTRVKSSLTR